MTSGGRLRTTALVALLVALLLVLSLLSVALGALSIPVDDVVRTLFGHPRTGSRTT
ncbi:iron complex transport system permease protein [Streptomyces sp. SolWspMP-sol7th]|nr:iron complex transport system permease protein [Streptomyces sp. SolWspMP-sol7th]